MKDIRNAADWSFETRQVHIGQEEADPATGARAVPIYATTAYAFRDCRHAEDLFGLREAGNIYSRLTNPTEEILEKRMASLEGGTAAVATASGAAAVTYLFQALARAGEHIVASNTIYGGTYNLLAHTLPLTCGITTTFVDLQEEGAAEAAIQENTKAVFVETMGNPHSNLADLEELSRIAHRHGIPLVTDSTFATPYLIRPIEHGADIVVHSATKFIGGHGTVLGGILVDGGRFDWKASGKYPWISEPQASYHGASLLEAAPDSPFAAYVRTVLLRDTGASISPFHAFLLLQGLETLSLRVERHVENTLKILEYLKQHPQVEAVHHPSLDTEPTHALYKKYLPHGGGSVFTFEIKGGKETAQRFLDSLPVFSLVANVADVKSLAIHPATTTHSQCTPEELAAQGIRPNTIRLSIGIEKAEDLIAALALAFETIKNGETS